MHAEFDDDREKSIAFYEKAIAAPRDLRGFLQIAGRPIQVCFLKDRGEFLCSTVTQYNPKWLEEVDAEMVAKFNAYHLFHGGYCLLVHARTGSLYVNQLRSAATLSAEEFFSWIRDFIGRSASCARWIFEEKLKPFTPRSEEIAALQV